MKKIYLLLTFLCCAGIAYGQKAEASLMLNTGLSGFGGGAASRSTAVTSFTSGVPSYISKDYYSSNPTITYGGSLQVQLVTPAHFLLGSQVGFEQLRSRMRIDKVYSPGSHDAPVGAKGFSMLQGNFMNLQPYVGWRGSSARYDLDLTFGTDIGFVQKMTVQGEVNTEDGRKLKATSELKDMQTDVRPRVGITGYNGPLGLSLSYAFGLTNYNKAPNSDNTGAYMRVLRIGMLYRF